MTSTFITMGENKEVFDTDSDGDNYNNDNKSPSLSDKEDPNIDGWQGWLVVVAASCALFIYLGVIYSWGVVQSELVKTTPFSMTTLTFVGSLATSFMVSMSIPTGMAIRRFGYQRTAFTGAIFMGLGEFLASWVTDSLVGLFICHSVLFGVGGGLTIMPCSTAPLRWFRKHRGLATGIVFGGGSLGAATLSVAANLLVAELGVQWTLRIFGILSWAICVPAAWMIRQPKSTVEAVPQIQWYRFRERAFILLFVGSGLGCFPLFIPSYFIPIYARAVASQRVAVIILAMWNVASTVGRVVAGFLADTVLGPLNSLILSLLLAGVSALAIWPFASSVAVLSVFIVLNGLGCGAFFSLIPAAVGSMFGAKNTMGVLPILWAGWFFGYFFGSPIAAGIYSLSDKGTGTAAYRPAAYYAGGMSLVGLLFVVMIRCLYSRQFFARV